jgi:hypothetical protein
VVKERDWLRYKYSVLASRPFRYRKDTLFLHERKFLHIESCLSQNRSNTGLSSIPHAVPSIKPDFLTEHVNGASLGQNISL